MVLNFLIRCKSYISSCVMISSDSINVFSRIMLLFSLVITDIDEDTGPQRIMLAILNERERERVYLGIYIYIVEGLL